ncbi:GIY-YIG nuclease family protein [Clostridium cochlearium]|uniref:GIY-YIG nuclease family protein n=1 Tax=Clostridium cochlearium TaxID=1494 RepID=UPI0014598AB5|nr:GIY-YIG nuclease family protein [Clostridium cochlearium]MBV1817143.1 GIY-YIG nuclease family protein [Bacteroidales bacterium MSK.15.36]MCG4579377.1 GIY-YIG nuclease family protein [Clostridium cochlearium]NME94435.1 GIY-YIG nuclease family protein [Clostridium cochlearium]NSJ90462.1 GIY-YIG nuclease family protein [Coprococcus sp. MSK.21.13]
MERQFKIYKITCINDCYYIGYTIQSIDERLRQHITRALNGEAKGHPFYEDIRHLGKDAFKISVLDKVTDRQQAMALEKKYIALEKGLNLYNLSSGGVEDASCGGKIFWQRLNEDPEARVAYLKKLSEIKKSRDWTDYEQLVQKSLDWRKENPKTAYKMSCRAIRIANRQRAIALQKDSRPKKEKLMWKYKRSTMTRKNAIKLWRLRTEEEKAEVGRKISIAQKKRWRDDAILPDFNASDWPYAKATVLRKIRQGMNREQIIEDAINNVNKRNSHWREVQAKLNVMGVEV